MYFGFVDRAIGNLSLISQHISVTYILLLWWWYKKRYILELEISGLTL